MSIVRVHSLKHVSPWLALAMSALFTQACESADDEPDPMEKDSASADRSVRREPSPDSGPLVRDAGRGDASPRSDSTCEPPIPAGELQNMASGASMFGQVAGVALEAFAPLLPAKCGLSGVRICVRDSEHCTESDAAGQFVLSGLETGTDTIVTFEQPGYRPALRLAQAGTIPIDAGVVRLLEAAASERMLADLGRERDETTGTIIAIALAPGEGIGSIVLPASVTMTLTPGEHRPYYVKGEVAPGGPSSNEIDREAMHTRPGGWAMFFGVPPGRYSMRFERAGTPCSQTLPGLGFGTDEQGHVKLEVVAGFATSGVGALCL